MDKKEYTTLKKKTKIVKKINEKIDKTEIDTKYKIELYEKDNIIKALDKNEFNFDTDSLSEDYIDGTFISTNDFY